MHNQAFINQGPVFETTLPEQTTARHASVGCGCGCGCSAVPHRPTKHPHAASPKVSKSKVTAIIPHNNVLFISHHLSMRRRPRRSKGKQDQTPPYPYSFSIVIVNQTHSLRNSFVKDIQASSPLSPTFAAIMRPGSHSPSSSARKGRHHHHHQPHQPTTRWPTRPGYSVAA